MHLFLIHRNAMLSNLLCPIFYWPSMAGIYNLYVYAIYDIYDIYIYIFYIYMILHIYTILYIYKYYIYILYIYYIYSIIYIYYIYYIYIYIPLNPSIFWVPEWSTWKTWVLSIRSSRRWWVPRWWSPAHHSNHPTSCLGYGGIGKMSGRLADNKGWFSIISIHVHVYGKSFKDSASSSASRIGRERERESHWMATVGVSQRWSERPGWMEDSTVFSTD